MTYEEAETLALKAIHDGGRGMIGAGRNHLHQRVARAILAARSEGHPSRTEPRPYPFASPSLKYSEAFVFEGGSLTVNTALMHLRYQKCWRPTENGITGVN